MITKGENLLILSVSLAHTTPNGRGVTVRDILNKASPFWWVDSDRVMVYSDGRRTQNPAVLVYAHSATAGIMSWNPANIEPQHTDFSVYDITTQSDTDMTLDFENSTVTVSPTALAVTQIIATGGHFIRASPFWFTNHTISIRFP